MLKTNEQINFKPFAAEDRDEYNDYLFGEDERGCEFSFANLYLWGRQSFAKISNNIILFSQFDRRTVYPFPLGKGNIKEALEAIISDSRARGIPCRITGMSKQRADLLEYSFPGKFKFHFDRSACDYVYDINDLAELKGKKYHGKKNHLNRFKEVYEGYSAEAITTDNIDKAIEFTCKWYEEKELNDPDKDFLMEKAAIGRAFRHYSEIGLEGLIISYNGEVLALTMGSRLSGDTFDVHFEKARADVNGAYTVINYEFARYIRDKYPEVKYLNREEDMGIEGLRRAKESYKPHHMVEKCWAHLLEDGYDY